MMPEDLSEEQKATNQLPIDDPGKQADFDAQAVQCNLALTMRSSFRSLEQLEKELQELREKNEIAVDRLDVERIRELQDQYRLPIMLQDLECPNGPPHAVEISKEELNTLGCFVFVDQNGKAHSLGAKDFEKPKLILLPKHFGNVDGETAQLIGDEFLT